jgi:hypothetical protein
MSILGLTISYRISEFLLKPGQTSIRRKPESSVSLVPGIRRNGV